MNSLPDPSQVHELYLNLLKQCLTRSMFGECYEKIPPNTKTLTRALRSHAYALVQKLLEPSKLALVHKRRPTGETMIGMGALENLERCITDVIERGVVGDLCETGVWRGGACIFMRALLKVHGDTRRIVWAADSFEGLPRPNPQLFPADRDSRLWEQSLAVSLEEVKDNFAKYGLLDDQVRFIKGFFSDTMPTAPIERLAVLRLDGDMYESTIVVLRHLYPKLSVGGYVIIDDYGMLPECNQAVEDFRSERGITEDLEFIGHLQGHPLGAYWKRLH